MGLRLLFRTLGHSVHLIEDMMQPSHVRNDPHASHGEDPTGIAPRVLNPSRLEDWAQDHPDQVRAMISGATQAAPVGSYNNAFETTALFSNQNFFSDDTILKNYAEPAKADTNYPGRFVQYGLMGEPAQVIAEDGHIYTVAYIVRVGGPNAGMKLAQVGYFGKELVTIDEFRPLAFQLDDAVAQENAAALIPQAVRYSAGLLDYFFRGDLSAEADGADGARVTNASAEAMDGTFELYYDDPAGNRKRVEGASWRLTLEPGAKSNRQTFTPPDDAETPGEYLLVFHGQLGDEGSATSEDAFAVVGQKVTLSQTNYLFVVPETVELGGATFDSSHQDYLNSCATPTFFYHSFDSRTWTWNTKVQRISGRFQRSGAAYIQHIVTAEFGFAAVPGQPAPNVYLDGQRIDPKTWTGDPQHQPTTWVLESQLFVPYLGTAPQWVFELSDGQRFKAPLVSFGNRAQYLDSKLVQCNQSGNSYAVNADGVFSVIDYSADRRYQIIQTGGYPYDRAKDPPCVETTANFFICRSRNGYETFAYISGASGNRTSDPGYFPFVAPSAEARFVWTDDERSQFKAIGMTPPDFTVTLR